MLVPVSRASPRSRNEEGGPKRDSALQSSFAVQGINPTLVDRSSHKEQSSHSLLGNRFAALINEAEERRAEYGKGRPEIILADEVPVFQTDTGTLCGQQTWKVPWSHHGLHQNPSRKLILSA